MSDSILFNGLKAKYVTFGCKLNFAETSTIGRLLADHGLVAADEGDAPDVIVVNTCSVTSVADRKCRQAIRTLHRAYPEAAIAVTGCYAQLKPDEVSALPGVVLVFGNDRKNELPSMLADWAQRRNNHMAVIKAKDFRVFEPSCSQGDRTRFFLKVQDGCNYFCSYCAIPYARGRSRSPLVETLIAQAEQAARDGGKEIVLTGVNIGEFGKDHGESLLSLIRRLDDVDGIERYRISSIEPNLLTEEIIDFVASSKKFMPHFHIPLQAGDDNVLRLMRRHYDTSLFSEKIRQVRDRMPEAFIGADIIVGMRGETAELFERSARFVESLDITRLHIFPYSEREGTAALSITPVVDKEERKQRVRRMMIISDAKEKAFSERYSGTARPVLPETFDPATGCLTGHTDNYIKVKITGGSEEMVNRVISVRLGEVVEDSDGFYSKAELDNE